MHILAKDEKAFPQKPMKGKTNMPKISLNCKGNNTALQKAHGGIIEINGKLLLLDLVLYFRF